MPRERWEGGYIHRQADGRPLYILERRIRGRKFHISTRCHVASAAYQHLRRFEEDPERYEREMAEGRPDTRELRMTAELVEEFRRWLTARERPATQKYANEMAHRLADWAEDLAGRDLRRLELGHLKEQLARRRTCRQHRIIALKSFFAWLRQEKHVLERKDDVTLDLQVPQAVPEKHKRRKAVPVESVRAALAHLAPAYRDCLLLLARTGWHVTELERFARDAESRLAPGRGRVLAVLQARHKTGATTRTPLLELDAVEAAQRIRDRGALPRRLNRTIAQACQAAGVPPFSAGVLRHSVATWAIEQGAPAEAVAEFLGHRDARTTKTFYADVAVPTVAPELPKL